MPINQHGDSSQRDGTKWISPTFPRDLDDSEDVSLHAPIQSSVMHARNLDRLGTSRILRAHRSI